MIIPATAAVAAVILSALWVFHVSSGIAKALEVTMWAPAVISITLVFIPLIQYTQGFSTAVTIPVRAAVPPCRAVSISYSGARTSTFAAIPFVLTSVRAAAAVVSGERMECRARGLREESWVCTNKCWSGVPSREGIVN